MAAVYGGWDQLPWDTAYEDLPNTHPRVAGTHGKSLRIARENGIPLMHVLATFSYYPAKYLGATGLKAMQERGRLQEGMVADITLIDPDKVTDNATYEKGTLPTTGLPYVLVNGTIVVKNSKVLPDVYPGQPIRFPVEETGRHESLTAEAWHAEYMVPSTGFHSLDSVAP
jgi:N-acyl-D-aspartate/D-glutamate deacylase